MRAKKKPHRSKSNAALSVVPGAGLEPARLAAGDFESPESTNFTTRAVIGGSALWHSAGAFQIAAAVLALWAWCCSRVRDSMRVKGPTFKCRVDPTLASQALTFYWATQ